jgi:hypothetical protein
MRSWLIAHHAIILAAQVLRIGLCACCFNMRAKNNNKDATDRIEKGKATALLHDAALKSPDSCKL